MATSKEAAHRGQRCPGDTRARLPKISMTAGTVWVQIGQCANPLTPFSTTGFIVIPPSHQIGRKNCGRGFGNLQNFSNHLVGQALPPANSRCIMSPWLYESAATTQDPDE